MTLNVKVTLRNPDNKQQQLTYIIEPFDSELSRDWVGALKQLLADNFYLEKNYCFVGFPNNSRNLNYLCSQLNQAVHQINTFSCQGIWQQNQLDPYVIEEWFAPDVVRFGLEYPVSENPHSVEASSSLGLYIKHGVMNRLHNHFERLQGTVWHLSPYYKLADYKTKYAIRQINNLCHEIETLILSQRKQQCTPEWIRPSQITTWLCAPRLELSNSHRIVFKQNHYDRQFGYVYMHWTQIGKTLFEVWRDEGAPKLTVGNDAADISIDTGATCEAINSLKFYSGEFDIEWGKDVVAGNAPWHDTEQAEFAKWLDSNGLDYNDTKLSLGYLPIGKVLLQESFGTTDKFEIWQLLEQHLDIYKIEVDGITQIYDYCWTDLDYQEQQINMLKPGYDYQLRTLK